jgi:hypothetical protein
VLSVRREDSHTRKDFLRETLRLREKVLAHGRDALVPDPVPQAGSTFPRLSCASQAPRPGLARRRRLGEQ